jgi:hypothetical protein
MTASIERDLRAFAALLLERRGGLVEWPAGAAEGTAVLPADLAAALGAEDETLRLSAQPGGEGWCVSLGTDFLDTAARLLEAEPRVGAFRIGEAYLKRGDLSEAVGRAFAWLNARVRIHGSVPVRVEYHTWWFHASAVSEDRWETRIPVTVNAASGAEVELPDPLGLWDAARNPRAAATAPATYPQAARRAEERVERLPISFAAWTTASRATNGGCGNTTAACCGKPSSRPAAAAPSPTPKNAKPASVPSNSSSAASWPS